MVQCLKITLTLKNFPVNFLQEVIQKNAQKFALEGTAQVNAESQVKIMVCGKNDAIEDFIDLLHQEISDNLMDAIEFEPFVRQKDYRGVFRIIE